MAEKKLATRDRFGNRVGTRAAKINACLSKEPRSVAQITEESKQKAVYNHLRWLENKGFVTHSDDGYAVKATGEKKSKKKAPKAEKTEEAPAEATAAS